MKNRIAVAYSDAHDFWNCINNYFAEATSNAHHDVWSCIHNWIVETAQNAHDIYSRIQNGDWQ